MAASINVINKKTNKVVKSVPAKKLTVDQVERKMDLLRAEYGDDYIYQWNRF